MRNQNKATQNRLDAVERQAKALQLRKQGATFELIAQRLGYADASGAYRAVMAGLKATLVEPASELRTLELERLDLLWAALGPGISQGKPRAIEVALRVMDRRAALLGLDAPRKVDVTLHDVAAKYAAEEGLDPADVVSEAERWLAELRG